MFLSRKNWHSLDSVQKSYLPLAENLRAMHMSSDAVLALQVPDGSGSVLSSGGVDFFSVSQTTASLVVDIPREEAKPNQRVFRQGRIKLAKVDGCPWQSRIQFDESHLACDMCDGPQTLVQQRVSLKNADPVAACRKGQLMRRQENGRLVFSIGTHVMQNCVVPFDVLWVPVKDAKAVLLYGKFTVGNPADTVNCGVVTAGQVIVEFAKPVQYQIAKIGFGGSPLLEANSEYAVPRDEAISLFRRAEKLRNAASRLPFDAIAGFGIYECAYADELVEGITGTDWTVRQVILAAAGMLDSFVKPAPILFPTDAKVLRVAREDGRLVSYLSTGQKWSLPVDAATSVQCADYSHMHTVGAWTRRDGRPLRAEMVSDDDVYAMLLAIAAQSAYTVCVSDRDMVLCPAGLLGSLAICDDGGQPYKYIGCDQSLWYASCDAYVLPRVKHDGECQFGSCLVSATPVASPKLNQTGRRRRKKAISW